MNRIVKHTFHCYCNYYVLLTKIMAIIIIIFSVVTFEQIWQTSPSNPHRAYINTETDI